MSQKSKYNIYTVVSYASMSLKDFKDNLVEFSNIQDICNELEENDGAYHFRIEPKTQYTFFGDIDHYKNTIEHFQTILHTFLKDKYNLEFTTDEFKYTKNYGKEGSYHYAIPKWNLSTENLKDLHTKLIKAYSDEFIYTDTNNRAVKVVDTSIYSKHWFRCPNQSKGNIEDFNNNNTIHKIIKGNMIDFIVDHIPDNSIDINTKVENKQTSLRVATNIPNTSNIIVPIEARQAREQIPAPEQNQLVAQPLPLQQQQHLLQNQDTIISLMLNKPQIYMKLFDECYNQIRFDDYDNWIKVGMAIKNTIPNEYEAIKLFNYFSSKSTKYEGEDAVIKKFKSFKLVNNGITASTLYKMAYEDKKEKTTTILSTYKLQLTPIDFCYFIKTLVGNYYFYKITKSNNDLAVYTLYCYNGNYWSRDHVLLKNYMINELYDFIKDLLVQIYWTENPRDFQILKNKLEKLKHGPLKDEIISEYKQVNSRNNIDFNTKWWLFGFENVVYDLKECKFRKYIPEDYVSLTCGYDWREPTQEEVDTLNNIITLIMPDENDRNTMLQILSTSIDGRCFEKFTIFNGVGRNGKGLLDDLLLATVGYYGIIGNNSILFESSKTGSNPEKANIDKKRLVIFREPSQFKKFENSTIKELTGGGKISARGHYENDCEKELNCTIICECNNKPIFNEPITNAEIGRIIDIRFSSRFTTDDDLIDHSKHIYKGNDYYKTADFKEKYKFAFFKILTEYHKKFYNDNNNTLEISENTKKNTLAYLEASCDIVAWFRENYSKDLNEDGTINNNTKLSVGDIYQTFRTSDFFNNLSKANREKYKKTYFFEFIATNIFFSKYYCERDRHNRYFLKGWKMNNSEFEYDMD
jgi:hypothetical protein